MSGLLSVDDLHVFYGSAHVLQGIEFRHNGGVLGLLGRNGMGKTTLARAIMGLVPIDTGDVRVKDTPVTGSPPYEIARQGVGYVPQGREIFPSLSVEEHLKMLAKQAAKVPDGWTMNRVFELFPRLDERRRIDAGHLSGGEQQMLAIGRALLTNPDLLIMDEPSEGLAPVIVEPLIDKLKALAASGMAMLLIEQNLRMATTVAEELLVIVSGQVEARVSARELVADAGLQERLLGVTMNA